MRKRILVIDDNRGIRTFFIAALEDTEYQLDTAESGKKGIESHKKNKYDLIFVDIKMPGMDGIEVMRQLRKISPDVRIYIITAFHTEFVDQIQTMLKETIKFEIIRKPISADTIVAISKSVLEGPTGF